MAISEGDRLPDATLVRMGDKGPEAVQVADLTKGRKVVIFAVPGAYTPTCHSAHVPSFIRTKDGFAGKGVDEIVCVSVNDPFVMKAWGESTGASGAGITMLGDAVQALRDAGRGRRRDAPACRGKPRHLRGLGRRIAAGGDLSARALDGMGRL